jgi:hypothetical protein
LTRIGEAKEILSKAIREEFGEFREHVEELSRRSSDLASESAGINGVSTFWRSLNQQLQSMSTTIADKETDVLAALAGKPKHDIRTTVDLEQSERVKAARQEVEQADEGGHQAA